MKKHYLSQIILSALLTIALFFFIETIRAKSIAVILLFSVIMFIMNDIYVSIQLHKDKKRVLSFIKYIGILLYSCGLFLLVYISLLLLLKLDHSNLYYTVHNSMNLSMMMINEIMDYLNKPLVITILCIEIIKCFMAETCFFYDDSEAKKKGTFILIYIVFFIGLRKILISHLTTTEILIYEIIISLIKIAIYMLIMNVKKLFIKH